MNLYSELVESGRRDPARIGHRTPQALFDDVRHAVDSIHANGSLKARITADLPRFVPRDPELALALVRLALGGRRLFLLTNSDFAYTDRICSYLFDGALPGLGSWRTLFDLVVTSAAKPSFFRRERPFVPLAADGSEGPPVAAPAWGGIYRGGSREGLLTLLEGPGEQVLYVGDYIHSDAHRSRHHLAHRAHRARAEESRKSTPSAAPGPQLASLREGELRLGYRLTTCATSSSSPARAGERRAVRGRRTRLPAEEHSRRLQAGGSPGAHLRAPPPDLGPALPAGEQPELFFGAQVEDFACPTLPGQQLRPLRYEPLLRVLEDLMTHDLPGSTPVSGPGPSSVHVVGGGLAGTECAWQLARRGVPVVLHEMRPERSTPAHQTGDLAELVCSNSLRSDDPDHPAGLLKREMERFGSLVGAARAAAVPAGGRSPSTGRRSPAA